MQVRYCLFIPLIHIIDHFAEIHTGLCIDIIHGHNHRWPLLLLLLSPLLLLLLLSLLQIILPVCMCDNIKDRLQIAVRITSSQQTLIVVEEEEEWGRCKGAC